MSEVDDVFTQGVNDCVEGYLFGIAKAVYHVADNLVNEFADFVAALFVAVKVVATMEKAVAQVLWTDATYRFAV
ncbi:MAG: hypothetical protein ACI8W8_004774 [Rhodothermales bacterium]